MKKILKLKILNSNNLDLFKKEFSKLSQKKLKLLGHDLVFFPEDFDHCCFEYLKGGIYKGKFSLRRAKRVLLIEQFCKSEIDYRIIHETKRAGNHLALISEIAEYCLIVSPVTNSGKKFFRLITTIAFGKGVESGFKRIYKSGIEISISQVEKLFQKEKKG